MIRTLPTEIEQAVRPLPVQTLHRKNLALKVERMFAKESFSELK